jgi:hypothetical protein
MFASIECVLPAAYRCSEISARLPACVVPRRVLYRIVEGRLFVDGLERTLSILRILADFQALRLPML